MRGVRPRITAKTPSAAKCIVNAAFLCKLNVACYVPPPGDNAIGSGEMERMSIWRLAQVLVFFLYLQTSQSSEMFDSVIYARRRELLNMKVSQWKPFLQRLDHSLRSNLDVNATCLRDMRSFVDAVMQRSAAVLNDLELRIH
ncbi:uncharacterized protein LOC119406537 [Rhipicephalus sanguineus]|uniref:uncharacterized protein LOC119406537 n=1 Tax=Rhipicephalus sanguineus TaxID=34632 RepID=UPI001893EA5A|nr:uncharacterized protein LOC119406537 [Rhipicephalus sanguineus]